MSAEGPSAEQLTPTEQRLRAHLEVLRTDPPSSDRSVVVRVVRVARWQRGARVPLRIIGMIAAAMADGLRVLVRGGAGGARR